MSATHLAKGDSAPELILSVPLSTAPVWKRTFDVIVEARTDDGTVQEQQLRIAVTPSEAPDVYLLIGQSNMVGESMRGASMAEFGEPDEPDPRIRQLNVTPNERSQFPSAEHFSNVAANVREPVFVTATDPLHPDPTGRSATQIGLGLSFAKAALQGTSAGVLLVPAAWGGTGFCGMPDLLTAWNPTATGNPDLGGTGLFERAVTRTDIALERSGGILRGILWLQGETDGENPACAALYERNLDALVAALRTGIRVDARGTEARGKGAAVPFVVGTLSRGEEFAIQNAARADVDEALRTIGTRVAHADVSVHDDLVPPAYPCGIGGCIHFGAKAYREMGHRYYDRLRSLAEAADRVP